MNTTTEPPAALPATITLSKSNIRDFIQARGVNVPIIVAGQSLLDFIVSTAQDATFNITKVPTKLKSDCQRAGQTAAKTALLEWVNQQFPLPGPMPEKLPRYTVDNGMIVACEAAERAIRPWVWGGAHHTNPRRQAAGKAAAEAKAVAAGKIPNDGTTMQEFESGESPASPANDDDVPFGAFKDGVLTDIKAPPEITTLDSWLTEHGLRTLGFDETEGVKAGVPWLCLVNNLTNESLETQMGIKSALRQGLAVQGKTELEACNLYALKNSLPWPEPMLQEMAAPGAQEKTVEEAFLGLAKRVGAMSDTATV